MNDGAERGDFEAALAEVNLAGARLGYGLAALLMPAGVTLDLVAVPSRVGTFFAIRVLAALVALALLGASYLPSVRRHPVWLGAGPPLLCAGAIETMIVGSGGAVSPYYAGLNLCVLAVAVLYTWRWQHALAVSGAILGCWLLPALPEALRGELRFAPFFNNLYFLTLTSVIAVASAVIRYRGAEREHDALSRLRHTSSELGATLERLQVVDRLKNEFFANVSHELRTPLTLILTPVEDLLSQPLVEPARSALLVVRRNAQRLLRLIDDLLDLARLDAGGLRLHVAELELCELTERVAEAARPTAEARRIELAVDCPKRPLAVHGDLHRLEIVLTNLLGNALKFTPPGGRITLRTGSRRPGTLFVEVEDTGPGIPEAELARIFDRFYQVEGSMTRRHGGAGLGLALAQKLVELHGGTLTARSQLGQGSTFIVELPGGREHFRGDVIERRRVQSEQHPGRRAEDLSAASEPPEPVIRALPVPAEPMRMGRGQPARVLVAEDEPDLREYIRAALSGTFQVTTTSDGAEALGVLRSQGADLVLTDLMMPGTSGTDLCRAIKQEPGLRDVPVIALTALSSTDNVLDTYSAGADDFVTKPFHTRVLVARIQAQLKLRSVSLQLADRARLATAGLFAAGIAHEVKNPLNAILNAARLLPEAQGRSELAERLLAAIVDGSERIEQIVGALEEHVRPAEAATLLPCDPRSGLESSLRLLDHKLNGVAVRTSYSHRRSVLAPARELNQVFLNLLDNAIRAARAEVWVEVADAAEQVVVSVADDGAGVPPEAASSIFEPFFTTRALGEGTGLGLYLSRRIVESCGGSLRYHPRDGGGAVFRVELPAVSESG